MKKRPDFDVIFFTHANKYTGFGHAARCTKIAKYLSLKKPSINIGFSGRFDDSALKLMRKIHPITVADNRSATISVYDRMDDTERPEIYDPKALQSALNLSEKTIFLANGLTPPPLPAGVICIGYKMGGTISNGPEIYWSLKYAPTDISAQKPNQFVRSFENVLIALGGDRGTKKLEKVLLALSHFDEIKDVTILLSPVNNVVPKLDQITSAKRVNIVSGAEDISSIFFKTGIIIASYGHLGYEAMASGVATCLFGQKAFQNEYAVRLAEENLCVAGGNLEDISTKKVIQSIRLTLDNVDKLQASTKRLLDCSGINRIANIILKSSQSNIGK